MSPPDRTERWIDDLLSALDQAAELAERGYDAYRADAALPLAFEALSTRIGELAKRMIAADPDRFADAIWAQAARNRDFVVHHYDRIDAALLWNTATVGFTELRYAANAAR